VNIAFSNGLFVENLVIAWNYPSISTGICSLACGKVR
jgi:hypothetical protein